MAPVTKEKAYDIFNKVMSIIPRNVRLVYPGPSTPPPPAMAWFQYQTLTIMPSYNFQKFSMEANDVLFPYLCLHELGHFEVHPGDGDTGSIIGYAITRLFNREYGVPIPVIHHPSNALSDIIVNAKMTFDPNVAREFGKTAYADAMLYRRGPDGMGDLDNIKKMPYKFSESEWEFFITWTAMTILKVKDPAKFEQHLKGFPDWMKEFWDKAMTLVNTLRMVNSDPERFYDINNRMHYLMFKNIAELRIQSGGMP